MDKSPKQPWTKPELKRLELTHQLLDRFAALADDAAVPSAGRLK